MASKGKPKKKTANRKVNAPAKAAKRPPKSAAPTRGSGSDESSEVLRASAKSFAARLLR